MKKIRRFLILHGRTTAIIFCVAFSLILLISAISMLGKYRKEITTQSESKALYYTLLTQDSVKDEFDKYTAKAVAVATGITDCPDRASIYSYIQSFNGKSEYLGLLGVRYFHDGVLLESNGDECLVNDKAIEYVKTYSNKAGYVGSFDDTTVSDGSMSIVGFYAPVYDSEYCSGVVIYYTRSLIDQLFTEAENNENAIFSTICLSNGKIISGGEDEIPSMDIFESLRLEVGDKTIIDNIKRLIETHESGLIRLSYNDEDCIINVSSDFDEMQDLVLIDLYSINQLFSESFDFVHSIIFIIIIFAVICTAFIIYIVVKDLKLKKTVYGLETRDPLIGCRNRYGFEKDIAPILARNSLSHFAVVVMRIRHIKYLHDTFGEGEVNNLLYYIDSAFTKILKIEECYGRLGDGDFVLLIHEKDHDEIIERLKVFSFVASKYKGANPFDLQLSYGVYEVYPEDQVHSSRMIEFALEAVNTVNKSDFQTLNLQINFYDDELRKIRARNESIELKMESALQNGEFQVFYQPKYNLKNNIQDGCEALVRWYDKKRNVYNIPSTFMGLFETNGFIVKLDKYVYLKVCEYLKYSMAHGQSVFPVSVNVSRITAIQPDFVEYYTTIKAKYGIPDNFIMIEFTESFAYENYDLLGEITTKLHQAGFKCSLDDFGSGYSSYTTLKRLEMDEIKLDILFLRDGINAERDNNIYKSVISLAKSLNMKVTQEGCETPDDIRRMRELGCDVIQGYYYSKPIPLSDYIQFCNHQSEHKIK